MSDSDWIESPPRDLPGSKTSNGKTPRTLSHAKRKQNERVDNGPRKTSRTNSISRRHAAARLQTRTINRQTTRIHQNARTARKVWTMILTSKRMRRDGVGSPRRRASPIDCRALPHVVFATQRRLWQPSKSTRRPTRSVFECGIRVRRNHGTSKCAFACAMLARSSNNLYLFRKNPHKKVSTNSKFTHRRFVLYYTHGCKQKARAKGIRSHTHTWYTGCMARATFVLKSTLVNDKRRWRYKIVSEVRAMCFAPYRLHLAHHFGATHNTTYIVVSVEHEPQPQHQ